VDLKHHTTTHDSHQDDRNQGDSSAASNTPPLVHEMCHVAQDLSDFVAQLEQSGMLLQDVLNTPHQRDHTTLYNAIDEKAHILCNQLVVLKLLIHEVLVLGGGDSCVLETFFGGPNHSVALLKFMEALFSCVALTSPNEAPTNYMLTSLPFSLHMLYVECLNTLIVCFSTSLYGGIDTDDGEINGEHNEQSSEPQDNSTHSHYHHYHQFNDNPLNFDPHTSTHSPSFTPTTATRDTSARKHHVFLNAAFQIQDSQLLLNFIRALIHNFIHERHNQITPSPLQEEQRSSWRKSMSYVFGSVGSMAKSIANLPLDTYSKIFSSPQEQDSLTNAQHAHQLAQMLPLMLGTHSITVLLLLLFYRKGETHIFNPFLTAFRRLENAHPHEEKHSHSSSMDDHLFEQMEAPVSENFTIHFDALLYAVSRDFELEEYTLLLYLLLQENTRFVEHLLAHGNLSALLLPMLHKLYIQHDKSSDHLNSILIILNILTQHSEFNTKIQDIELKSHEVSWFKERIIVRINFSSFLSLILLHTVTSCLFDPQKIYSFLVDNCISIVGNLSSHFKDMHTFTSQKLVNLLKILCKKYKTTKLLLPTSNIETSTSAQNRELLHRSASLIMSLLDIIHCILIYALKDNFILLYQLIQQRNVLTSVMELNLQPVIISRNIAIILSYFEGELNLKNDATLDDQKSVHFYSVEEIMRTIRRVADQLNVPYQLQNTFTALHFKYSETDPEPFFVPIIWSVLLQSCDTVEWELDRIQIELNLDEIEKMEQSEVIED